MHDANTLATPQSCAKSRRGSESTISRTATKPRRLLVLVVLGMTWTMVMMVVPVASTLLDPPPPIRGETENTLAKDTSPWKILLARHGDWIHAQIYHAEAAEDHSNISPASSSAISIIEDNSTINSLICHELHQSLTEASIYYDDNVWRTVCQDPTTSSFVDLRPFYHLQNHHDDEESSKLTPVATWAYFLPSRRPTHLGWMPPPLPRTWETQEQRWQFHVESQDSNPTWWQPNEKSNNDNIARHQKAFANRIFHGYDSAEGHKESSVRLLGELSQSGGMHRKFRQTLYLNMLSSTTVDSSTRENTVMMDIMVFLPPDLFINVEEAIEIPPDSPITRQRVLDLPPNRVIDQEEPTFASPAHGVVLRLEFPTSHSMLEWDLLLHLRYPSPLKGADFTLLALMPPVVWSLRIVDTDNSEKILATIPCPWKAPAATMTPHYTWVAAGREEYFMPLVALTALMAAGGSILLIRELARTTRARARGTKSD